MYYIGSLLINSSKLRYNVDVLVAVNIFMKVIQYFLDLKSVIRNPLNSQILKYLEITYCSYLYVHLRVVFLSGKFCSTSVPFKYYIRLLLRKFKKVFSAVKRESTYVYLKDLRYMPLKYCFIFYVSSRILIKNAAVKFIINILDEA